MLDTRARKYVQPLLNKVADGFIKMGFTANGVTILAFIIGLIAAVLSCWLQIVYTCCCRALDFRIA